MTGRVTDLVVQNDCPDEAQGQLLIAIHDVVRSDVDQLDLHHRQCSKRKGTRDKACCGGGESGRGTREGVAERVEQGQRWVSGTGNEPSGT